MNEVIKLDVHQRKELSKLETVIQNGLATFIEVGLALRDIRDSGLYKEKFPTFEKYVAGRWGFDKSYAYRLIDAAEVKEDLSPMGDKSPVVKSLTSERQLRELARVNRESLPEVIEELQEIEDAGEKITAKVINQVATPFITPETEQKAVDWQKLRTVALRHGEAMVRAIDDLCAVRKFPKRDEAVRSVQGATEILRGVK